MIKKIWNVLIVIMFFMAIITTGLVIWYVNSTGRDYTEYEKVSIMVNEQEVIIDKNAKNKEINLLTFNTEFDTIINVNDLKRSKIKVNNMKLEDNNNLNLGKVSISKQNKIEIKIKFKGSKEYETYYINTLSSEFPEYEVEGKSNYEGDYYITTRNKINSSHHYILKLSNEGEIKYYKRTKGVCIDFRKIKTEDDKYVYTYLQTKQSEVAFLYTSMMVMDENYKEINQINYSEENEYLEDHYSMYISDNHYILVTQAKLLWEGVQIRNTKIKEIKDNKVLWEFQSKDYPELYDIASNDPFNFNSNYYNDLHYNSMVIDTVDNNLICSFRHLNTLLKIDRTTGKIIWKLGGELDEFGLTEEQKFAKQHSVTILSDESILIYNNNNPNENSEIVNFKIDEINKKIIFYRKYDLNVNSVSMGSVQEIDKDENIYLMCYGTSSNIKDKYIIEEKNLFTGEIYFKFKFNNLKNVYNVNKI